MQLPVTLPLTLCFGHSQLCVISTNPQQLTSHLTKHRCVLVHVHGLQVWTPRKEQTLVPKWLLRAGFVVLALSLTGMTLDCGLDIGVALDVPPAPACYEIS